jgi:hypothetical protein
LEQAWNKERWWRRGLMGRRLNWEKAKRRDRQRVTKLRASAKKAKAKQRRGDDFRQQAIQAFVAKHSIECFGCGT